MELDLLNKPTDTEGYSSITATEADLKKAEAKIQKDTCIKKCAANLAVPLIGVQLADKCRRACNDTYTQTLSRIDQELASSTSTSNQSTYKEDILPDADPWILDEGTPNGELSTWQKIPMGAKIAGGVLLGGIVLTSIILIAKK